METQHRKTFMAGIALIVFAFVLLTAVFFSLSTTDANLTFLLDTPEIQYGWTYETVEDGAVTTVQPKETDGFSVVLPGEGVTAVRISRVMNETLGNYLPKLNFSYATVGVEVFLDGIQLYANVAGGLRDENGFLALTEADRASIAAVSQFPLGISVDVTLPDDYLGRTLQVITYYPEPVYDPMPLVPAFGSESAEAAQMTVSTVWNSVFMVVYAIALLTVLALFVTDLYIGHANVRTLLLALFFLLVFLESACFSLQGAFNPFFRSMALFFPSQISLSVMFLYVALGLRGKKKWIAVLPCTLWFVALAGIWLVSMLRQTYLPFDTHYIVPMILGLMLAVCWGVDYAKLFRQYSPKKRTGWALTAAGVFTVCYLWHASGWTLSQGSLWQSVRLYTSALCQTMFREMYFDVFMSLVADICAVFSVISLFTYTIQHRVDAFRTVDILEKRSRIAMADYERMLRAQEATSAVRHEMRHHMAALSGLLQSGETDRAAEYVAAVQGDLDRLPDMQYSPNMLVNALAGMYLDKAKRAGVRVEYALDVPAKVGIADEDLTVLLTNLLENAVQACEKIPAGMEKFIEIRMHVSGSSLFVGCVNSAPPENPAAAPVPSERREHGYGLEAMRRVAEKYDSVLKLDRGPGQFSVKTNLALR